MTRDPLNTISPSSGSTPRWSLADPRWVERGSHVPRVRLIIDNDFAGDPDDLFQLVHHLLSPSVDIRAIAVTHCLLDDASMIPSSVEIGMRVAERVLDLMGITDHELLVAGAARPLGAARKPIASPAVEAILAEARRDDARPLFYAAGGSLTELASAVLIDPSIAERMTVVWIGGPQHDDVAGTQGRYENEYNRDLDLTAAQVVFEAGFDLWQVPRDLYRRFILSESELRERVARAGGPIGEYIYSEIAAVLDFLAPRIGRAEMYPMGDQPLVALTVLQGVTDPDDDFTSAAFVTKPTPRITDDGRYAWQPGARPMRVYTDIDQRLLFEDFYNKLAEFARWQQDS